MAWSDDVRCLYCDGKLPLYRKLTSGQFCSAVHRKAYWQDQERLAVERLHQTHDSLRAYRPPEALEAILGKPVTSEPASSSRYQPADLAAAVESQPTNEDIARSASNTGNVKVPGFLTEDKPALRAWHALLAAWDVEFAQWPMSAPSLPSPLAENIFQLEAAPRTAMLLFRAHGLAAQIRAEGEKAVPVGFTIKPIVEVRFALAPETEELSSRFLEAGSDAEIFAPEPEPIPQVEETPFPAAKNS